MSEPKKPGTALATTDLSPNLMAVLRSSLYPGAKDESIQLVWDYCKAAGLDAMKKPVHIVPMSVSTGRKNDYNEDIKESRDVIMPGIGLYRTDAARTGEYVGMDPPVEGPVATMKYQATKWVPNPNKPGKNMKTFVDAELSYPEWCEVTVRRKVDGEVCLFTAREYWVENYATAGRDSDAPNEMWRKRPRGQLMKCAEAQALRKAFPEQTGSQPTAEEMEGRAEVHMGPVEEVDKDEKKKEEETAASKPWPDEKFEKQMVAAREAVQNNGKSVEDIIKTLSTRGTLNEAQLKRVRDLAIVDAEIKGAAADAPEAAAEEKPAAAAAAAPVVNYASIADSIVKATSTDELDDALSLISGAIKDKQLREELFEKVDAARTRILGE